MKDFKKQVYDAMCNYEYGINPQRDYDVLRSLNFDCEYGNELACLTNEQIRLYKEARKEYHQAAIDNDWF